MARHGFVDDRNPGGDAKVLLGEEAAAQQPNPHGPEKPRADHVRAERHGRRGRATLDRDRAVRVAPLQHVLDEAHGLDSGERPNPFE